MAPYLYAHSYSAKDVFWPLWGLAAHLLVTLFLCPWMLEMERQRFLSYNEGVLIWNYVTVNLMLMYHYQSLWTDIRSIWLNFDHKSKEMLSPKNERFIASLTS